MAHREKAAGSQAGRMGRREFCAVALASAAQAADAPVSVTIAYQATGGVVWPVYIARDGGYYKKYGLEVTPAMAIYPGGVAMLLHGQASMLVGGLQQLLPAALKDGTLVATGAWMNRSTYSLMVRKDITRIQDLKGRRIAVSQVGDPPYGYLLALLKESGLSERDVNMVVVGAEPSARAAALTSGHADATLLFGPGSFRLEDAGFRVLTDLAAHNNIFTSVACWARKESLRSEPDLMERLIQAHAEAIHRFYEDKAFAVRTLLTYFKGVTLMDASRIYGQFSGLQLLERVPYVLTAAVIAEQDQKTGAAQNQTDGFRPCVDNSFIDRLVKQGFFVKLFGPGIRAEEAEKSRQAFR